MTGSPDPTGVSVILPVFLKNPTLQDVLALRRSLESVLDQQVQVPQELLLIDDGSNPPVADFAGVLGVSLAQVRTIRHRSNRGVSSALNTGLTFARYDLFARIDADDYWWPDKFKTQLALFSDSDVTITATGMVRIDKDGKEIDRHERPDSWAGILNFFCEVGCPFPHASVIAKRSVWRLLGGYPQDGRFSHCEDLALWEIWLRFFKPAIVPEVLLAHTVSDRSVSIVHSDSQRRGTQIILQRFRSLGLAKILPGLLHSLAERLGGSLMEAGCLAYALWRFPYRRLKVPLDAVDLLQALLPDRLVEAVRDDEAPLWHEAIGASASRKVSSSMTVYSLAI